MDSTEIEQLQGNWNFPTQMFFGAGRIKQLVEVCAQLNINKALLVTDAGLAKIDFVADIIKTSKTAGLSIDLFSDVKSNPTESNVVAGVACYQKGGFDGVIALGGGSALDAGKAIGSWLGRTGRCGISKM